MDKNRITINKRTLEKSKKFEVYGDIIVPDIKPDIVNIINTNANTYIYKTEISDGKVRVDGNIDAFVIYLADNGETRSISITLNFSEFIEDSSILSGMKTKEKTTLLEIESKILNERKISVKAQIDVKAEMWEKEDIEFVNANDEMIDVQKLEERLEVKSCVGENISKASIKENIKANGESKIADILKTNVNLCNLENKISYNKVLAKADANISILYLSEENNIEKLETTIPVMTFIDIQNVSDTNTCLAEYTIRNMLYKIDVKESLNVEVQIEYDVDCTVYENKEINVIQDMYSTKSEIVFNQKEALIMLANEEEKEIVKVEDKVLVENINSIYDVCFTPVINNKIVNGDIINYEAEVLVDILFEADNRNGINFQRVNVPFVFRSKKEIESSDLIIETQNFGINNEYINCNLEINIRSQEMNMRKINIIDNIESKENSEEDEYKMIVYFVKKGDTIWSIAKKFKVYMENIIKLNNLENPDKINVGDRLYIMR